MYFVDFVKISGSFLPKIVPAFVGNQGTTGSIGIILQDQLACGTADSIDTAGKLIFIVLGCIIYFKKYKIDEKFDAELLKDLETGA